MTTTTERASGIAIRRTSAQLLADGALRREQLHTAALVLARLQDRGIGRALDVCDMCEVLGYVESEPQAA